MRSTPLAAMLRTSEMWIDDDSPGAIARQCLAAILSGPQASGRKQPARHSAMAKRWNNMEPFDIADFLSSEFL